MKFHTNEIENYLKFKVPYKMNLYEIIQYVKRNIIIDGKEEEEIVIESGVFLTGILCEKLYNREFKEEYPESDGWKDHKIVIKSLTPDEKKSIEIEVEI